MNSEKHIGLDVHQATISVAVLCRTRKSPPCLSTKRRDEDGHPSLSVEHDRLVAVGQDAVAEVQADGAAEDGAFEVTALADHVFDGIAVGDAGHCLFDDWTFIQIHGHVVACGPDQFHAAQEGLMVGLGADEGGKKRMMDIDNAIGILGNEVFAQDLHVAGQHDQLDAA